MNCPTCGYLMEPTDLECPRCKLMATKAAATQVTTQQTPAQGTTPQNPIYVQDPYVHIIAKAHVDSVVSGVNFAIRLLALIIGGFAGFIVFGICASLFTTTDPQSSTSPVLACVVLICSLVVIFFVTKWSYKFLTDWLDRATAPTIKK